MPYLSFLLVLLLALSSCAGVRMAQASPGPSFTLLTWNVNYGMPAAEAASEALLAADVDVVCLQETTPAWEAYLRPRLAERYPHTLFRHDGAAGGLAFLSKHPLTELAWIEPPPDGKSGWFPAWLVQAEVPGGPVQVLNVHLRPPVSDEGSFVSGYYGTRPVREREVQRLVSHLRPLEELPAVIAGDFNEDDRGQAVRWLRGEGFTDTLREFDRSSETWRWRTRVWTLRDRLDHVMHSDGLGSYDARVLRVGGSDHFPVVAVLEREGE